MEARGASETPTTLFAVEMMKYVVVVIVGCAIACFFPATPAVFGEEVAVHSRSILIPFESVLLICDPNSEGLTAISIHSDAVMFSSIAYLFVWHFPDASSFYSLRENQRFPSSAPISALVELHDVKHRIISVSRGNELTIGESKFRWFPNTGRSSWLKLIDTNEKRFVIWRVKMPPPSLDSFLSFDEAIKNFNQESLKLGAVPID